MKPAGKHRMLFLFVLIWSMMFAVPSPVTAAPQLSDQEISDAVEDEIQADGVVPLNKVEVMTVSGIVTLTGTVDNLLAKERARRLVETVRGVKSVINRLAVAPIKRPDAEIERDIVKSLSRNPALKGRNLKVQVSDSVATISGNVQSWPERAVAKKIAKSVKGLKEVRDEMTMSFPKERPDSEIRNDVIQVLKWDALVERNRISVDVREGVVTLTGTVGSAAERTRAIMLASVMGVRDVDGSNLEVAAWLERGDRAERTVMTDDEIQKAVDSALLLDPRTNSFRIAADVAGRIVTLRGVVQTIEAKRAAEQDARNTTGVIGVKNRLKVNPDQEYEDKDVAADVRDALATDPVVYKYDIDVSVIGGIAYLTGTVDSLAEKRQAEYAASRVPGVVEVENRLNVFDAAPYMYDPLVDDYYFYDWYLIEPDEGSYAEETALHQDTRNQLFWSPFVDADQVQVSVDGSVVTLTGTVDSTYEKEIAAKNAFDAGALGVVNKLLVK